MHVFTYRGQAYLPSLSSLHSHICCCIQSVGQEGRHQNYIAIQTTISQILNSVSSELNTDKNGIKGRWTGSIK